MEASYNRNTWLKLWKSNPRFTWRPWEVETTNQSHLSWKKPTLLQHNARWHTSAATSSAKDSIRFEVVPHPLYSLHLALSDSCLFASLKKGLKGIPFTYNEDVQVAMWKWFWEEPKVFYSNRFKKTYSVMVTLFQTRGQLCGKLTYRNKAQNLSCILCFASFQ